MAETAMNPTPMAETSNGGSWYALAVKPRHEKVIAKLLSYKGLEDFLPQYRDRRRWSDRIKLVELPLFSGYLFCRFSLENRLAVLTTPGVRAIVGFGKTPSLVPDEEIDAVRAMVQSGLPVSPWPFLREGQVVVIEGGPLRGLEGRLARATDAWRVVVNVDLLQRSVAVTMDRNLIGVVDQPLMKLTAAAACGC